MDSDIFVFILLICGFQYNQSVSFLLWITPRARPPSSAQNFYNKAVLFSQIHLFQQTNLWTMLSSLCIIHFFEDYGSAIKDFGYIALSPDASDWCLINVTLNQPNCRGCPWDRHM